MPAERFRDDLESRNIFGISWYLAKSEEEMDRGICVQAAEDTFLPLDTVATLLHGRDAHVWLSLRMHAAYFSPELHGVKRRGQTSSRSTAAADKLLLEDDQKKSGNDEDEVEVAIRRRIEKRLRRVRQKEAEEGAKEAAAEALFQQEHQGLSATAAPQAGEDGSVLDEVVAHYFPGTAGGSHNYSGNNTPGRGSLSARGGGGGGVWLAETSRISAKSAMFLQASLGETPEGDSVLIRPTSAQNLKSLSPSPVVVASPRNVLLSARGEPARSARDLSEIVRQQYGDASSSSKNMSTKTATSRASRNGGSQQGSPAKVELHQGGRAGGSTTTTASAPRFVEAEAVEDEVVEFAASALPSSSINTNNADGTEVINTPPRSVRFFGRAKGLVGETPPGAPPLFYNDPVVPKVQVPSLALSGLAEPASDEGRNLHNNASPSRAAGPGGGFNSARVLLLSHRSTTLSTARSSPGAFAKRQLRLETEDATLTEKEIEVVHNCFERSLAEASADIEFEQPKVRITFVHLEPVRALFLHST
eukprot:g3721.t1